MVNDLLLGFRLANLEQNLGVYGIHVHRDGYESLEHRFRVDERVNIHSGAKTVTALAVGIAMSEGLIALTDPLIKFFPEYQAVMAEGTGEITVRDALCMTSGSSYTWFRPGQRGVSNPVEAFFSAPLVPPSEQKFEYSSASSYVLSKVTEKLSGLDIRDYLMPRIFGPLGYENPQWLKSAEGSSLGNAGLMMTTSEFAKIGQLLLQHGQFDGRQLVPREFMDAMHLDVVDNSHFSEDEEWSSGYGYHVWMCSRKNAWRADGLYGQFSIVIADKGACVTVTAHNENNAGNIVRAVWSEVLPRL